MHKVYLLLGSNKGNRRKFLLMAMYFLQQEIGSILRTSSVYITAPWGNDNQPKYLNQALIINTPHTPLQLLKKLQKIEKKLGRTNKNQYTSRTIDIDILFYDNLIFKSKNLEIPHPRLHLRNFTLRPLLELEKSYSHPKLKKSIEELAKDSADTLKVSIFAGSEVALFK
ncbi:MAG TPA: 2-amino-4-hydroxy-6-hydroxymethyldihydropteridine diphosphokinase [Chitinophagales bacterium]|nr:2-amino-4-hydroxy-6-hydroxymethyldihydropteridine diphosphokinase [Chitinophagales bacterium]